MLKYHHYVQLLSLIVGLILYRKYWPLQFKLLIVLAGITCVVEISGSYIAQSRANGWLYNPYVLIQGIFLLFIFYKLMETKRGKILSLIILLIFPLALLATYYNHPSVKFFNAHSLTVNLVACCFAATIYFIDIMVNSIQIPLLRQPGFWFAVGTLVSSVTFICRFAFYNLLVSYSVNKSPVPHEYTVILSYLIIISNTFMYVGFIATFLCLRLTKK